MAAAARADLVVLCVGEAACHNGEATSRTDLDLSGHQRALAEAVLATGKPVIAIVFSGRPPIIPWLVEKAQALMCPWFLGTEAGNALADVLTGKEIPRGRLAMTWPRSMGQVPIYFAAAANGRPFNPKDHFTSKYLDCPNDPLFAFGHGLATTTFAYSGLAADGEGVAAGRPLTVTIEVANTGPRAGEAVLFCFIRDPVAKVVRPGLELRGFDRILLQPGERRAVSFTLDIADVAYPRDGFDGAVEPGALDILVGPSAALDTLLAMRVQVETDAIA